MKKIVGVLALGVLLSGNVVQAEEITENNGNAYAYGHDDAYGQLKKMILNPWNFFNIKHDFSNFVWEMGLGGSFTNGVYYQKGYWENDVYITPNRIIHYGFAGGVELTKEQRDIIKKHVEKQYNATIKWEEYYSFIDSRTQKLNYQFRLHFDIIDDFYTPTEEQFLNSVKAYLRLNNLTGNPTIEKSDDTYIIRITETNILDELENNNYAPFYALREHIYQNFYATGFFRTDLSIKGEVAFYFKLDNRTIGTPLDSVVE